MLFGTQKSAEVLKIGIKRIKSGEVECELRLGLVLDDDDLEELEIGKTGFATQLKGATLGRKKMWLGYRPDVEEPEADAEGKVPEVKPEMLAEFPAVRLNKPEIKQTGLAHMLMFSMAVVLDDEAGDDETVAPLQPDAFFHLVQRIGRIVVIQLDESPLEPELFGKDGKAKTTDTLVPEASTTGEGAEKPTKKGGTKRGVRTRRGKR